MRELIASPSASRTVGTTTISTGKSRSRDHAPDHHRLLGVLLAEEGEVGADRVEELRDDRGDAAEVLGPAPGGVAVEDLGQPAADLDRGREARRVDLVDVGRVDEVDARALGELERRAPRRAGRRRGPRPARTGSG